jgi:hypothetical protein
MEFAFVSAFSSFFFPRFPRSIKEAPLVQASFSLNFPLPGTYFGYSSDFKASGSSFGCANGSLVG